MKTIIFYCSNQSKVDNQHAYLNLSTLVISFKFKSLLKISKINFIKKQQINPYFIYR